VSSLAPLFLSLGVATTATLAIFLVALPLSRLALRRRSLPLRLIEGFFMLPLVLPPTVTGLILLVLLGRHGPIGSLLATLGIPVVFTRAAAVIASATVAFPLMYQSCKAAFEGIDPRLARAAETLGAIPARVFLRIELPLAAPGILGGVALSFARAFGEFGATLMLAGNIPGLTETLPLAVFSAVESGDSPRAGLLFGATVFVSLAIVLVLSLVGSWPGSPRRAGKAPARRREG